MERREEKEDDDRAGGAGGKLTRRSFRRRVQPSPYDRPPKVAGERKKGDGWLHKLLVRPASRILPSLFSAASAGQQDPPPSETIADIEQEDCDNFSTLKYHNQFEESKEPGACPKVDEPLGYNVRDPYDGTGLAEIEQQLKQKLFSRDESNRLIELLRSRTTDLPSSEHAAGFISETLEGTLSPKNQRTSAHMNMMQLDRWMTRNTSDPLISENYETGSSPVELAKAYMGALVSGSSNESQCGISNAAKNPFDSDDFLSKLHFSSAVKSPICWPGAVIQRSHAYHTPQNYSGRVGRRNSPWTPYSGAVFSKSMSKFQGGDECNGIPLGRQKRTSTPSFGSDTGRAEHITLDFVPQKMVKRLSGDGFASVGPRHQVDQKNMETTASKSKSLLSENSDATVSLPLENSDALKNFSSAYEKGASKASRLNLQSADIVNEASRSNIVSSRVHPQSSEMAQKILEHLQKTAPSSKGKSLKLNLDIARTKAPSKPVPSTMLSQDNHHGISASDDLDSSSLPERDIYGQEKATRQKVFPASSTSQFHNKDLLSFSSPQSIKQGILDLGNGTPASKVFQIPNYLSHSSDHRSGLISLSTSKHNKKYSDNGFGFTFPVHVDSNAISEPPTPTMASTPADSRMLGDSEGTIPSFSFGSSKGDRALVFSFGSNASSCFTETTTPRFKFGSDKERCLSFASVGKDAICV